MWRRLLHLLTLKQLRYCSRCHRWSRSGDFTFTDERGRKLRDSFCGRCRIRGFLKMRPPD